MSNMNQPVMMKNTAKSSCCGTCDMRNLFLRLPEERVPLPGKQLPVRLPQARRCAVMETGYRPPVSRRAYNPAMSDKLPIVRRTFLGISGAAGSPRKLALRPTRPP